MTDFDITKISDSDLCEAGRRLQQAHDYVEAHGFSVSRYDPGRTYGECCYIGTVKTVGGERPRYEEEEGVITTVTLRILDALPCAAAEYDTYRHPGRLIELAGIVSIRGDHRGQALQALPVFRQAIREVQAEMDRRAS